MHKTAAYAWRKEPLELRHQEGKRLAQPSYAFPTPASWLDLRAAEVVARIPHIHGLSVFALSSLGCCSCELASKQ